jgi:hypothetical protein
VRGECVPSRVAAYGLHHADPSRDLFDSSLQDRFVHVMPPPLPGPRIDADP